MAEMYYTESFAPGQISSESRGVFSCGKGSSFTTTPLEGSCHRAFVSKLDTKIRWREESSDIVLSFNFNESLLTHSAVLEQLSGCGLEPSWAQDLTDQLL